MRCAFLTWRGAMGPLTSKKKKEKKKRKKKKKKKKDKKAEIYLHKKP